METTHAPAGPGTTPSTSTKVLRRCVALALLATALVPMAPPSGSVAAAEQGPFSSVDDVPSEGAEPVLTLVPDDWAPGTGATVRWTVEVENLAAAAATAGSPRVWLNASPGLVVEEVEGALPADWSVEVLTPSSVQVTVGEDLAPGESTGFVLRSTVTAGADDEVGLTGGVSSEDQWFDTPRAGSYAALELTVGGAELSGTVVAGGDGSPLRSVCVDVEAHDGGGRWHRGTTRSDGSWNVSVPAGPQYRVRFDPGCQTVQGSGTVTAHAASWFPGVDSGGDAHVVQPLSDGPDLGTVELGPGGAVSGTVGVPDGSDPTRVWVSIDDAESGWWVAGSSPAADGTFLVQGVPAGQRVARFQDNDGVLASRFHAGASQRSAATSFDVSAGVVTTGVDVTMEPGATIEGVVTASATGDPLGGIAVVVRDLDGEWVGTATTRADGTYQVSGLPEGSYRVRFEDDDRTHLWVFHDGAWTWSSSEPEFLAAGVTWQLDAAMSVGSTVTGRVTAGVAANGLDLGDPIADVAVVGWIAPVDFDDGPVALAVTDDNGEYVLTGVPPTKVDVLFLHGLSTDDDDGDDRGGEFSDAEWAAQFWEGADHPSDATPIDLSQGTDPRPGIDAALVPAPAVSGRVLDADGGTLDRASGVAQVAVGLFVAGDDEPLAVDFTGPDGSFEVRSPFIGLETHLLTVDIDDVHEGAYPPLWFGNVAADLGEDFAIDPTADGAASLVVPSDGLTEVHLTYDPPDPPAPVTDLVATPEGSGFVVSWSPAEGVVDHYSVLVGGVEAGRVAATGAGAVGLAGVGAAGEPYQFTVSDLVENQRYDVSVTAANLGGATPSTTVSVTVGVDAGGGPSTPVGVPEGAAPGDGPAAGGPAWGGGTPAAASPGGPSTTPAGATAGMSGAPSAGTPPTSAPAEGGTSPQRLALTGTGTVGLVVAGLSLLLLGSALGRTRRRRVAC